MIDFVIQKGLVVQLVVCLC